MTTTTETTADYYMPLAMYYTATTNNPLFRQLKPIAILPPKPHDSSYVETVGSGSSVSLTIVSNSTAYRDLGFYYVFQNLASLKAFLASGGSHTVTLTGTGFAVNLWVNPGASEVGTWSGAAHGSDNQLCRLCLWLQQHNWDTGNYLINAIPHDHNRRKLLGGRDLHDITADNYLRHFNAAPRSPCGSAYTAPRWARLRPRSIRYTHPHIHRNRWESSGSFPVLLQSLTSVCDRMKL